MGHRVLELAAGALACSLLLGVSGHADEILPRQHPGLLLDRYQQVPVDASIKAWPGSDPKGADGDCPKYGDSPLDAQSTARDGNGAFRVAIPADHPTYTMVYCGFDYVTRIDTDLPNATDGSPVPPTPTELWPSVRPTEAQKAAYEQTVQVHAIAALNELAYLAKVDPEAFGEALKHFEEIIAEQSPERAEAFQAFTAGIYPWMKLQPPAEHPGEE